MFNEEIKRKYISTLNGTNGYPTIFKYTEQFEESVGKDLYDFTSDGIEKLEVTTEQIRKIMMYINWSQTEGLRKDKSNLKVHGNTYVM